MILSDGQRGQMENLDIAVTQAINGWSGRSPALDAAMLLITQWGVPLMIAGVALSWWQNGGDRADRHVAVTAGLTFLLGLAVNQIILLFVHRMRPYDAGLTHLLISPSADASFPSDHATAGFAIVLAYLLKGRRLKAALLFGMAAMVMISRIYVGTHYVSDILGGALTALAACLLVKALYREGSRLDQIVTGIL
jgi:undecaprenyl-diphosphatase